MKVHLLPLVCVAIVSLVSFSAFASDDAQTLFDQAIKLKEAESARPGVSGQTDIAPKSSEVFDRAAGLFESKAQDDWHVWYEAGNARWWAGQSARAIVDYRRYIAHDYFRGEAWENLAEARRSAETENPGHEGFLSWPWPLWFASGAAFLAGLSVLAFSLFLFFRSSSWRLAALSFAVLAAGCALGSAGTFFARDRIAVVATETQGRKGDSSVYAAYPAQPWKAGQEVIVTEVRDTWTRVIVGNTVSWIPSGALVTAGN